MTLGTVDHPWGNWLEALAALLELPDASHVLRLVARERLWQLVVSAGLVVGAGGYAPPGLTWDVSLAPGVEIDHARRVVRALATSLGYP